MVSKEYDLLYKIFLIGDSGVGKSLLMQIYMNVICYDTKSSVTKGFDLVRLNTKYLENKNNRIQR